MRSNLQKLESALERMKRSVFEGNIEHSIEDINKIRQQIRTELMKDDIFDIKAFMMRNSKEVEKCSLSAIRSRTATDKMAILISNPDSFKFDVDAELSKLAKKLNEDSKEWTRIMENLSTDILCEMSDAQFLNHYHELLDIFDEFGTIKFEMRKRRIETKEA